MEVSPTPPEFVGRQLDDDMLLLQAAPFRDVVTRAAPVCCRLDAERLAYVARGMWIVAKFLSIF